MIAGRPMSSSASSACGSVLIWCERGVGRPILRHGLAEQLAVFRLVDGVGRGADHLDVEFLQHAHLAQASAQFSAVCPPMVGSSASGRSRSMILATISGVIGSM